MVNLTSRAGCFALTFLAWALTGSAMAQTASLSLQDTRTEVDRLAPHMTSGQAVFLVDNAGQLEFDIVTTQPEVATRIVAPNGVVINPDNAATFGGQFARFTVPTGAKSVHMTPAEQPGFHSLYRLPSRGPGNYTVQFDGGAGLTEEMAVITQLTTNSRLAVALVAPATQIVAGNAAVLSAAVFAGTQPFTGASVQVALRAPNGQYSTLTLSDNGTEADNAANDGLYSGEVMATLPGTYHALARISGTWNGHPFARSAAARFTLVERSSQLTGAFNDQAVDDDLNSLFDRVVIRASTNTLKAGDYRLFVGLTGSNRKTLLRTADASLPLGPGDIAVSFEALALLELGDGPYQLSFFELMSIDALGTLPADRIDNVGQTQAYLLSQFQRPLITLTGSVTDQGIDDNANGRFDRLVVGVEVDVVRSGTYEYGFKLMDRNSVELGFYSRAINLPAGRHTLTATFNAQAIGENGIDGPYLVRDLLMYGGGGSLVSVNVGQTQAYRARQFEGFVLDTTPPQINIALSPNRLWPPNHQLVPVTATLTVADDQDPHPAVELVSIVSNEPDNGPGDGNTSDDIRGAAFESDDRNFELRAERSGQRSARIYTITYRARDAAGNEAMATSTVTVPHGP